MKTLIINGSPRKNGNTTALVNKLTDNLQGEYKTLNAYYCNISPCIDCRYCRDNIGCAINDEMQEIYDYILECNNILIASPIYFSEITGRVLDFGSRLQTYFSAMHFRNEKPIIKIKKGAVILVGAGDGKPQKAYDTAVCLLHHMNVKEIYPIVCSFNTDNLPASEDNDTIACVSKISKFFNSSDSENNEPIKLNSNISIQDKINLYRSLFKGRDDVYAQRWYNPKTEKSGYSPICKNKWAPNVCNLPKIKCADCSYRSYLSVSDKVIFNHLSGKDELCRDVIGIYPMLPNETTFFLALDFDDDGWKDDLTAVREVCKGNNINAYAERSRSGNGAHLWIFFEAPIPAVKARKLGSGLLTLAMKKRHELKFESYDRMFPNQDTMPSGGFGNLIALPLQKQAVNKGNSVFIDDKFKPYPDQWTYLLNIKKHSGTEVEQFITSVCNESELGNLFKEEQINKPWEISILNINNENDFPDVVSSVMSNMIYIPKAGISQSGLNKIKRLAAFTNPDFYKSQAMRLSTHGKPRVIGLSQEDNDYIMIPRGCIDSLEELLVRHNSTIRIEDKSFLGKTINVTFNGVLRDNQQEAVEALIKHNNGILAATTAFGKTVTAAGIIAKMKTNTLILVHTQALLEQWKKSLSEFLIINENLPEQLVKRGKKANRTIIGQIGGGKNTLNGIIDIALIQSLYHNNEVNPVINNYGMIFVDECHHISAVSFEAVLREAHARYIYGLTATPKRSDGQQPIIFMQCGKIRYTANASDYAKKHRFNHILIPIFTKFRML